MFGIGGWELLMIAVVALIVLGPKGLPAAARAIGKVLSELRRATNDLRQSLELDPELKDLPHALDELNRPLLSPSPYPRKRVPRDGPPDDLKLPPNEKEPHETTPETPPEDKSTSSSTPASPPEADPTTEQSTPTRDGDQKRAESASLIDEPDGQEG